MTTDAQDRRVVDLAAELEAARVVVTPIGPCSLGAVLAEAFDRDGHRLGTERILESGTPTDPGPWLEGMVRP